MLHLGRNYVTISPIDKEGEYPSDVDDPWCRLSIREGMTKEELADELESFARFLRANKDKNFDLAGSID